MSHSPTFLGIYILTHYYSIVETRERYGGLLQIRAPVQAIPN